jgi:superfamily II RNA helicase
LVCFFGESKDEAPSIEALDVPPVVRQALRTLKKRGEEFAAIESSVGAPAPPKYTFWEIQTDWVELVYRWISDPDIIMDQICADYGVYSGNVTRVLLKVGNLLEEWRSLATLNTDVEALEKVRDSHITLSRGITVGESLYLR